MNCVLLADRHHGLCEALRGLLESAFDGVFMVADEPSLIEGAGRLRPTVAVVDLSLGKGDLLELVRSLRDRSPETKILFLSTHDEPTAIAAVLKAGVDGLVLKRAVATDLLPAVEALLAGRRFIPRVAAHAESGTRSG